MVRGVFFALLFFTQMGICLENVHSKPMITNPQRSDGFGAQFQTLIYTAIYAELTNKQFIYTPFERMEHNYEGDPEFLQKKETLINFLGNFQVHKEAPIPRMHFLESIRFFEQNIEKCIQSQTFQKIKKIFRENKKRERYFDDQHMHIVIHVRRKNKHDSRISGTDISDRLYLELIDQLRTKNASRKPLFHIHSQGDKKSFELIYEAKDIVLHLNESVEDAFTAMVLADALVTSASSLSYTAALLSEGQIYYMPFWHPPLAHWVPVKTFRREL